MGMGGTQPLADKYISSLPSSPHVQNNNLSCHPPPPFPIGHRIYDVQDWGVVVKDEGTKATLERCELWANRCGGLLVEGGGDLSLSACSVRDHAKRGLSRAYGVYVAAGSSATVGADCVFARNVGGDVVRQEEGGGEGGVTVKKEA